MKNTKGFWIILDFVLPVHYSLELTCEVDSGFMKF